MQGSVSSCAALGVNAATTGGIETISEVDLTVRWGLVPSTVALPLGSPIEAHGPSPGECPPPG